MSNLENMKYHACLCSNIFIDTVLIFVIYIVFSYPRMLDFVTRVVKTFFFFAFQCQYWLVVVMTAKYICLYIRMAR